ncbi:hypothetical protein YC2023_016873 [Brassica napus]
MCAQDTTTAAPRFMISLQYLWHCDVWTSDCSNSLWSSRSTTCLFPSKSSRVRVLERPCHLHFTHPLSFQRSAVEVLSSSLQASPSMLLTAIISCQAWLVVVVEFVFRPAAKDSSSATPVVISVVAELCEEKVDLSNGGFPFICTSGP